MKEFIYKAVDFFTFGKGLKKNFHGHDVRLPTRYINYFPSQYEKDNFDFLKKQCKQGDVVLDIGAHIGLFSAIAAQLTGPKGKVFAFEPTPNTNVLLKKTIKINKLTKVVEPRNEAMGSKVGETVFFISNGEADNSNSLISYVEDRKIEGIKVQILTVDSFVKEQKLDKVNFIKIDVEGAEFDTLQGAKETLKQLRPVCILAIHPNPIISKGDKLEDIYDFVKDLNYQALYKNEPITKDAFLGNRDLIDLHLYPR